jgi:hypothetical protein
MFFPMFSPWCRNDFPSSPHIFIVKHHKNPDMRRYADLLFLTNFRVNKIGSSPHRIATIRWSNVASCTIHNLVQWVSQPKTLHFVWGFAQAISSTTEGFCPQLVKSMDIPMPI